MNTHSITAQYLKIYSSFFNRSNIIDYINNSKPQMIKNIIESNENTNIIKHISDRTYAEFFDFIYAQMKSKYRCEYVYLNEIFIKEVLKNHDQEHAVLTELRISKSQADLVVVNGTTTVYEIKTELDNLSRLENQLSDYINVFDRVNVITHIGLIDKVQQLLVEKFPSVGIFVFDKNWNLKLIKNSHSNIGNLKQDAMFKLLNKNDYSLLNHDYYVAREIFYGMTNLDAHTFLKNALFFRGKNLILSNELPTSLMMASFKVKNRLNKRQKQKFTMKLKKLVKEDL